MTRYRVTFWNKKTQEVRETALTAFSAMHAVRVSISPELEAEFGAEWIPTKVEKEVILWETQLVNLVIDPSLCLALISLIRLSVLLI